MAIFMGRASFTSPATRSRYGATTSAWRSAPGVAAAYSRPAAMRWRSACTPSPYSASPASTILSPLYSGGLWLPVISTPDWVPSSWVA